jgi:hypothetical protein
MERKLVLTSVKVPDDLFEEFKVATVRYKFSLQKLVERSMDLYLSSEEFRKQLHNHHTLDFNKK